MSRHRTMRHTLNYSIDGGKPRWAAWKWVVATIAFIVLMVVAYAAIWLYVAVNYHPEWF